MATPTPNHPMRHNASQQGQGRTPSGIPGATPPVSTPFSTSHAHAAFSPRGPKSSPQQFKRSPATSTTLMGHPGNGPLNFDSPSAAAAMGALGIGGGLDMGLDNVGVGALGGLGNLSGEDERLKRLDAVLDIIGKAKGRVSEAGLERLSLRTGLNKMWEEHRTPDGRITKTLVVAGNGLQLDINLDNNIVRGVTLAFPESESTPNVTKHVAGAEQILLRALQLQPNQSPLTKTCDEFAANLERLALLDRLSVYPGLDCQEAIAGIDESLEKLYKWELSKMREDPTTTAATSEQLLEKAVMCEKSGRPSMNARDQVGPSIDYWTDRHLIPFSSPGGSDIKFWSILVGCKPLDGELYQPIRVSENWISDKMEKADPGPEETLLAAPDGPVLDWLEPEPTILPSNPDNKSVGVDVVQADGTTQKFPNVKFVATLNPPVIVPQSVCNTLYGIAGAQPPPMLLPAQTFDNISFPIPEGVNHDASELRTISCQRDVLVKELGGELKPRRHENTLFVYKPVYGQTITELPFSHPRQVVAMLPVLRQYAFISRLLSRSFGTNITGEATDPAHNASIISRSTTTKKEEFQDFLGDDGPQQSSSAADSPLRIDVVLSVHPTAGLNVVFPFRDATANIELQIQPNATVHVVSQNVIFPEEGEDQEKKEKSADVNGQEGVGAGEEQGKGKKKLQPQDLGHALEMFEDLCQWAEWIRTRLA
ncbi:hypothetical protein SODALDRAFT_340876 [Sodiomyces alkalinus F11]|uniref:Mediator of RNA polymerase II transcription subunit 1 n=1 Tax=Sodiomyces alkalinus (strain CBS 110278 / VKM F-3762 / F11) TaxID=1314773 RepID=A0A3N2PT91_SODAK|nr:hypothetical protein SODALDRAFT_340876 [Sodiomyces alkalinus F11]ROT37708.1 hypothetical protein SODALDRAFT_340876 [Sodiomyces alkalinus F11]